MYLYLQGKKKEKIFIGNNNLVILSYKSVSCTLTLQSELWKTKSRPRYRLKLGLYFSQQYTDIFYNIRQYCAFIICIYIILFTLWCSGCGLYTYFLLVTLISGNLLCNLRVSFSCSVIFCNRERGSLWAKGLQWTCFPRCALLKKRRLLGFLSALNNLYPCRKCVLAVLTWYLNSCHSPLFVTFFVTS